MWPKIATLKDMRALKAPTQRLGQFWLNRYANFWTPEIVQTVDVESLFYAPDDAAERMIREYYKRWQVEA